MAGLRDINCWHGGIGTRWAGCLACGGLVILSEAGREESVGVSGVLKHLSCLVNPGTPKSY